MATNIIRLIGSVNTTSSETVVATTHTISSNKLISATVEIFFYDPTNMLGGSFSRKVIAKNNGGVASLISGGGTNIIAPQKDSGYSTTSIQESVATNVVSFTVSGQTSKPLNWYYVVEVLTF